NLMLFRLWLRSLKPPSQRSRRRAPGQPQALRKLMLERLEDRLAPATLTVNSLDDTVSGTTPALDLREATLLINSGGTATDSSGNGLSAAKASQIDTSTGDFGSNDTIQFDPGLFGAPPQMITLGGSELLLTSSVTIAGPGAGQLAVSGNGQSRVLSVSTTG